MLVIPELGRRRQGDPWGLLASQPTLNAPPPLDLARERLSPKIKTKRKEKEVDSI